MKSYFALFKMTFKGELQYRAKAISGIITQLFWGAMYISLYTAFMNSGTVNGFTIPQMASYIWLGQAFFAMKYVNMPKGAAKEIVGGNVCYKFTRPINLYSQWYAELVGQKLSATLLRFAPIIVLGFVLPASFGLMLPVGVGEFFLFLFGLVLGLLMSSAIGMIAVYLTFRTLSQRGMAQILGTITSLLCGSFVPLPLLPQNLQKVISYMPFRVIGDLPFRIYIGNISVSEGLVQMAIGTAWFVVVVVIGVLLLKLSQRKTEIQGG